MSSEAELEGLRAAAYRAARTAKAFQEGMATSSQTQNAHAAFFYECTPEKVQQLFDSLQSTRAALERAEAVVEAAKAWEFAVLDEVADEDALVDTQIDLHAALKALRAEEPESTASREDL